MPEPGPARILLWWLPLGAGGRSVRWNGLAYEALMARRQHRPRAALFHSALEVHLGSDRFTIEMTPVWGNATTERGVVAEGPVGSPWLGRSRLFRYEVRRWRDGVIPDLAAAVGGPVPVDTDDDATLRLLDLVPSVPALTWGRDERHAGEMWNSNSLTAWLLAASGLEVDTIRPPAGGRAPGWQAGLVVAGLVAAGRPGQG